MPWDEVAIASHLKRVFASYDAAGHGLLTVPELQSALRDADLHLSWLQIQAVTSEAEVSADGAVDLVAFADKAAGLVRAIHAVQLSAGAAAKVIELRTSALVHGMDRDTFKATVAGAFAPLGGGGPVPIADARAVLLDGLHLDQRQVDCLLSAAVAVSGNVGEVDPAFVAEFAFEGILQLMELDLIRTDPSCVGALGGEPAV